MSAPKCCQRTEDEMVTRIVRWMRGIPREWREDWGLNATEEIADLLGSGLWLLDGEGSDSSCDPKGEP